MFEAQQKELQSLKDVVSDAGKDIGLSDIKNEMSDIASSIEDVKPTPSPETEVKKKSVKRAKPLAKVTAKSNSRAKPAPRAKTTGKPKPRAIPKAKSKPKASAKAASASKPPKPTAVKRARVKAK